MHRGRTERPPHAHPLWRRESATPATPSGPGTHRGRAERPPPAHPLWCREKAPPGQRVRFLSSFMLFSVVRMVARSWL
eukprot:4297647-Pyramimonas_sp.AAC.1